MSLLPARFQTSDDMPMNLGKAIARAIAPKVDSIEAFEKGQHSHMEHIPSRKAILLTPVPESDCRQIKGAAKPASTELERAVARLTTGAKHAPPSTEPWVKFRVGDRVRLSAEVVRKNHLCQEFVTPFVIARIEDGKCYDSDGSYAGIDQIEPAPSPDAEGLIEGAIYRVKFPSGGTWLTVWRDGAWHGSAGLNSLKFLHGNPYLDRNDEGEYEVLGLEWEP